MKTDNNPDLEMNGIADILASYIQHDKLHQAVLLDAPWGEGKTWYLKNDFIPSFSSTEVGKDWHFIYMSLFGLSSISELEKRINQQLMNTTLNTYSCKILHKEIPKKLYSATGIALNAILKHVNLDMPDCDKLIPILPKVDHIVYVLDDMERTEINFIELLGFVNNLCEHDDSRVILVANEAQILSRYKTQQKMQSSENLKNDYNKRENLGNKYSLSPYDQAKEKAVSLTIKFQMNSDEAFRVILNFIVEDNKIKNLILGQKSFIMDLFLQDADKRIESLDHYNNFMNLRILAFIDTIINDLFQEVFKCLEEFQRGKNLDVDESKAADIQNDMLQDLLRYTAVACFDFKMGDQLKSQNFSYYTRDRQIIYFGHQYTFVKEFVSHRIINLSDMSQNLMQVMKEYEALYRRKDSSLEKLYKWEYMDDEEVYQLLGKLKTENFPLILEPGYIRSAVILLLQLKAAGFDVDINSYISAIIASLKAVGTMPFAFTKDSLCVVAYDALDEELMKAYNEKMTPVCRWFDKEISVRMKAEYSSLINNEWDDGFSSWCVEHKTSFMSNKKFLWYVDVPSALQKLEQSNSSEIYCFHAGISKVYNFMNINEFFKADLSAIEDLLTGIHGIMKSLDKIPGNRVKKYNLSKLYGYLKDVENRLR